MKSALASVC